MSFLISISEGTTLELAQAVTRFLRHFYLLGLYTCTGLGARRDARADKIIDGGEN